MRTGIAISIACVVAVAGLVFLGAPHLNRVHIERVSKVDSEMAALWVGIRCYRDANPEVQKKAAEIAKVLRGGDHGEVVFIEWRTNRVDASGNFLDVWGMPYEISGVVPGEVRIRCAGRDRTFGTRDDKEYSNEIR